MRRPILASRDPWNIILTSLLLGIWLAFPPNLGVFCLHGRAFLAIGLVSACGLATTLDITFRCNTIIRSEFVCCALVACDTKYVHLLATSLNIIVRCNTAIRSESVRCMLITRGQVFVCYSATTLCIVVCCDTTIRLKSIRYVLVVIRLLPICHARFR